MAEENSIRTQKPMLDTDGQIDHLIKKGVKFDYVSVDDARKYLEENNNYFRLRAYRKNFDRHPDGENKDKYIDLDFAMLVDLSVIDMRFRYVLLKLVLDVEHFAKVKLLKSVSEKQKDGYQIVDDYFAKIKELDNEKGTNGLQILESELSRNENNPYCGGIIKKYKENYSIWAFVEVIPMGSFINFFEFCANRLDDKELKNIAYLLKTVKVLRNAAAHSNCLLHDMKAQDSIYKPHYHMSKALSSISPFVKDKKLKNERTREITTLLYTHSILVTSKGVHDRAKNDLNDIIDRMYRNIGYYKGNDVITSNFEFYKKVVDILFK